MIPTVGRIIHVSYPNASGPCRAAIVAALDYNPNRIYAAVFDAHNAGAPVHNAVVNADDPFAWHDPRSCPDADPIPHPMSERIGRSDLPTIDPLDGGRNDR